MMHADLFGKKPWNATTARAGLRTAVLAALVVAATFGATIVGTGCSQKPPIELPDPASGEFLTLEQQRALGEEKLTEYCDMLDAHLERLREDIELAYALGDSLDRVFEDLSTEATQLNREKRSLQNELRNTKRSRASTVTYVTREGDSLIQLAALFFDSSAEWRKIYDANAELIEDPGEPLPVGMILRIPN